MKLSTRFLQNKYRKPDNHVSNTRCKPSKPQKKRNSNNNNNKQTSKKETKNLSSNNTAVSDSHVGQCAQNERASQQPAHQNGVSQRHLLGVLADQVQLKSETTQT